MHTSLHSQCQTVGVAPERMLHCFIIQRPDSLCPMEWTAAPTRWLESCAWRCIAVSSSERTHVHTHTHTHIPHTHSHTPHTTHTHTHTLLTVSNRWTCKSHAYCSRQVPLPLIMSYFTSILMHNGITTTTTTTTTTTIIIIIIIIIIVLRRSSCRVKAAEIAGQHRSS